MSAQGATLRRGTIHLPIWPVIALVAAAAVVIGIVLFDGVRPGSSGTSVTQTERLANSSAAIREQGIAPDVIVGISHVAPRATLPAVAPDVIVGISHVAPRATLQAVAGPTTGPSTGIIVNGVVCHQCR